MNELLAAWHPEGVNTATTWPVLTKSRRNRDTLESDVFTDLQRVPVAAEQNEFRGPQNVSVLSSYATMQAARRRADLAEEPGHGRDHLRENPNNPAVSGVSRPGLRPSGVIWHDAHNRAC
jgi:hypothetical protein